MKQIAVCGLLLLSMSATIPADAEPVWLTQRARQRTTALNIHPQSGRVIVNETYQVYLPEAGTEVQFQWRGAKIDEDTVSLHCPEDVRAGQLRRPAGKPKVFFWHLTPENAGAYEITASFLLNGIKIQLLYDLYLAPSGETAALTGKIKLRNGSNMQLRDASVRLCGSAAGALTRASPTTTRSDTAISAYAALENVTLKPDWHKLMTFFDNENIPAEVVYRANPEQHGQTVHRHLILDMTGLSADGPLPKGQLDIYQQRPTGPLPIFSGKLQPTIDEETDIRLGPEPNIVYERDVLKKTKQNVEFDAIDRVSGYDKLQQIVHKFRNRRNRPVQIQLEKFLADNCDYTSEPSPSTEEDATLRWNLELAPDAEESINIAITRHIGSRAE